MRTATGQVRARTPYWLVPVFRATVALATGLAITFTPDHSANTGLVLFGIFAVITGLGAGVLCAFALRDPSTRLLFLVSAATSVACGAAALVEHGGGFAFYLYVVSIWAAVTGILELMAGLRRPSDPARRDWLVSGALTLLLAIMLLLIPEDSVLAVGLLGAYAIVLGVYLAIGGLSQKWAPRLSEGARRG